MNIKRGEIYYADLSPVVGSEQGGVRPVLIVQNDGQPGRISVKATSPGLQPAIVGIKAGL